MKRSWLARHPIGFMALYFLLYLSAFNFLETQISMPRVLLVHCRLDDLIPFCKYAVIPYFAWFVWIPFTLFYLLWRAPREDFWRLCLPLFAGMTIALACYVILPTGLALRPYYVPGNDFFARTVRTLYRTDTPTNVCPSIHVFNSVTLLLAYYRCRIFEQPRRRWMLLAAVPAAVRRYDHRTGLLCDPAHWAGPAPLLCAGHRSFCPCRSDAVPHRHCHQRVPVHPCVQLGDPDAGLPPLPPV